MSFYNLPYIYYICEVYSDFPFLDFVLSEIQESFSCFMTALSLNNAHTSFIA